MNPAWPQLGISFWLIRFTCVTYFQLLIFDTRHLTLWPVWHFWHIFDCDMWHCDHIWSHLWHVFIWGEREQVSHVTASGGRRREGRGRWRPERAPPSTRREGGRNTNIKQAGYVFGFCGLEGREKGVTCYGFWGLTFDMFGIWYLSFLTFGIFDNWYLTFDVFLTFGIFDFRTVL